MNARNVKIGIRILCCLATIALVSGSTAQAANLLNYYEFEGNYNGTVGAAALPAQNPAQLSFVGGGFRGQSLDINDPAASGGGNTGGSVDVPINVSPPGAFTFGGWVNLQTSNGFPGFTANDNGGWDRGIHMNPNGSQWGIASGGNLNNISPTTVGQWQFVVGTFDKGANTATLYVGDDNPATQTTASGSRADGAANGGGLAVLEIGRYDNQDLDALVDDYMVWDEALTNHEANAVRNLRLEPGLDYSPVNAETLFDLFDAAAGIATIGGLEWTNTSGLIAANPGAVFDLGGGAFSLVLDDSGNGVIGQLPVDAVPEPPTLIVMGLGLLGAWWVRRRRRK